MESRGVLLNFYSQRMNYNIGGYQMHQFFINIDNSTYFGIRELLGIPDNMTNIL